MEASLIWCLCALLLGSIFLLLRVYKLGRSGSLGRALAAVPPGRFGPPLVGETLQFLGSQRVNKAWSFFEERERKYGPVFKTSLVASPTVVLPAPEGNKFVFANENKLMVNSWPSSVARLLGPDSLTLKTGDAYKRSRAVLMAYLKPEALQAYVSRVCKLSMDHLSRDWHAHKEEISGYKSMKKITFAVACTMFFSLDKEADQEELAVPFYDIMTGCLQLPLNFPGTRYYKALRSREKIMRILDRHISRRKEDLRMGAVSADHDLLSVLLTTKDETGKITSDSEIKDNILLLLFAGHDTSSCTMTMCLKFLAENPAWKQRLLEEHLQVLADKPEAATSGYVLNWEDLRKLKWSWRTLQETLRLQPPVQGTFRKAIVDFKYAGFTIPKGWKVYWTVNRSHRREEFFPEPDKFDPTRFEGDGPAPYTFVPFGGGPRMCPGYEFARMEMLVLLHYLLVGYEWQLVDKQERISVDPMPFPVNGLPLKIRSR